MHLVYLYTIRPVTYCDVMHHTVPDYTIPYFTVMYHAQVPYRELYGNIM